MVISISPETMLYLVAGSGHDRIYGVPDVFADKTEADCQAIASRADAELTTKNYATMNMEGKVDVDPGLLQIIDDATESKHVTVCSYRKPHGNQIDVAYYQCDKSFITLTREYTELDYFTRPCDLEKVDVSELDKILLKDTEITDGDVTALEELTVESKAFNGMSKEKLSKYCAEGPTADLIFDAFNNKGGVLIASEYDDDILTDAKVWVYGDKGILKENILYRDGKEFLNFSPVSKDDLLNDLINTIKK